VFRLAGGSDLSGGLTGFGSLWTYDIDSGRVLRVDPATHRVLARVPVRAAWSDVGLAIGAGAVWAVSTHNTGHTASELNPPPVALVRIDPQGNRIMASLTLRAPDHSTLVPLGVITSPGAIWVWGAAGAQKIDPRFNRVTDAVTVRGDSVRGFAATGTTAWAVTETGRLVRFDARTGARLSTTSTTAFDRPKKLVLLPQALVVDREDGSIAKLDATTGRTRWTAHPGSALRDATMADGRLWILTADPTQPHDELQALDPNTGRTTARIALPTADSQAIASAGSKLLITTQSGKVLVLRH
jgi:hypothetical protein